MMNALYGAVANKYFIYYVHEMAEAITMSGRLSILTAAKILNEYMNKILKTTDVDYVIYIDTDSVEGSSMIIINGKEISIADYYESTKNNFVKNDIFNENYVKEISNGDMSPSVSTDGILRENLVKYVMKHKVKKRQFKISDNRGNSVIVTEDHSIIVKDKKTGNIFSIKPTKLNSEKHLIINIDTDSIVRNLEIGAEIIN